MTTKKLANLTNELTTLNDELNKIRKAVEGLKKTVDNREAEIKKYIQKINDEEDKIFQDFVKKNWSRKILDNMTNNNYDKLKSKQTNL